MISGTAHDQDDDDQGRYRQLSQPTPLQSDKQLANSVESSLAVDHIPTDKIGPNPYQPRAEFSQSALSELAQSISQQGMLQPLVIAPAPTGNEHDYLIIAGERRLRAARQLSMETVPCIIRSATRRQMLEWALIENIQRTDLNPIERAQAYEQYIDRFNLTQAQAAERLGQPRATVANHLRLLGLHDKIKNMLKSEQLTFGHGKVLASLNDNHDKQIRLATRAAAVGLTVRQLEEMISSGASQKSIRPDAQKKSTKPPYIKDIETRLSSSIGAKVYIVQGRDRNKGRIIIHYNCLEDFDRIAETLGLEPEIET